MKPFALKWMKSFLRTMSPYTNIASNFIVFIVIVVQYRPPYEERRRRETSTTFLLLRLQTGDTSDVARVFNSSSGKAGLVFILLLSL